MEPSEDFKRVIPNDLIPVTDIDVRELSEIYDERDVYLSIYLPTSSRDEDSLNESYFLSRSRAITKALKGEVARMFEETLELSREHVTHAPVRGEKGRIIYASAPLGFLHIYRIGVEPERKMVLDTSPFLLPLARLRDDYEDYAILLMDSQQAKLFVVESRVMKVQGTDSIDLMNKHKKGGMSQMRFNRLRRGAIHSFVSELVEDLEGLQEMDDIRGIVLAGPGEAKKQLLETLPPHIKEMVLGVEDISMDVPEGELLDMGERVTREDELRVEKDCVEELRCRIMKGLPSAYGAQKVKAALNEARVNILLLLDNASIPGWICERCQNIHEREAPPPKCPHCGGPTSPVDVVEELYELSQRTRADVEFIEESDFLSSLGGIGAILRY
jgi:peptide chain release factor subunit 1